MKCPNCKAKTRVTNSRPSNNDEVLRSRLCRECGFMFWTTEMIDISAQVKKETEYALYKGDDLLVIGTLKEIADHQGVDVNTIRFFSYPSYKKRAEKMEGGNYKILISLEDDEE